MKFVSDDLALCDARQGRALKSCMFFGALAIAVACKSPDPKDASQVGTAASEAPIAEPVDESPPPPEPRTPDLEGFTAWLDWLHQNPDAVGRALLEEPLTWFSQHFDPQTAERLAATYERERDSYVELLPQFLERGTEKSPFGPDGPPSRSAFIVTASDAKAASTRQAKAMAAATAPLTLFGFDTGKDPHNGDENGARVESFVFHDGHFVYIGDLADAVSDLRPCAAVRHRPSAEPPKPRRGRLELGDPVGGLAVDNTGQTVAVSRLDGPWLWKRKTGELVRLPFREHWSFCVEIAADKLARPRGLRGSAVMNDRATPWHEEVRHALAITEDLSTLYFGGHDGSVVAYALATPEPKPERLYRHSTSVVDLDVSSDGALVVSAGFIDGPILWDGKGALRLKDPPPTKGGSRDRSLTIAFSPDARRFVVAQPYRFWEVGGALEPFRTKAFVGNHPFTVDVAWTADGKYVVGAGEGIEVWDVAAKTSILDQRLASPAFVTSMSPDGSVLATSHEGFVQLWEPMTATETRKLKGISGVTMAMAWSPDGRFLAVADADGLRVQVQTIAR